MMFDDVQQSSDEESQGAPEPSDTSATPETQEGDSSTPTPEEKTQ